MRHAGIYALIFATALAACGTDQDQVGELDEPGLNETPPSPAMQARFADLRSEVDSVVENLRTEVEGLRAQLEGDTLETWTETSARVEEGRGDLLVQLDRLDAASVDEADDIRDNIAGGLAGIEAEVVRQELRLVSDPQAAAQAIEERLADLDQSLDTIQTRTGMAMQGMTDADSPVGDPAAGRMIDPATGTTEMGDTARDGMAVTGSTGTRVGDAGPDADDVRDLREQIQEARAEVAQLTTVADAEEREDVRLDLSNRVADLTRDVRTHWYAVRYSFDQQSGVAMGSPSGL